MYKDCRVKPDNDKDNNNDNDKDNNNDNDKDNNNDNDNDNDNVSFPGLTRESIF